MSQITDEQIHEVFSSFDVDGSGTLSMTELSNALNLLGIDLTEEELADTYRIDDDPDTLNEEEFKLYIRDRIGDINFKERTVECFREFLDDAEFESISRAQLKEILTQRGTHPIDEESAEELLNEFEQNFDLDGDGRFNVEEICNLLYHMDKPEQAEES